jgi:hypothetical protein
VIEKKEVLIVDKATGERTVGHQVVKAPRAHSTSEVDANASEQPPPSDVVAGESKSQNSKAPISSIAALIEYAYSRKGKRIAVKASDLKAISGSSVLPETDGASLRDLVTQDRLFAVPRQLLLFARELREAPRIRSDLREFVKGVLEAHPIIIVNELQAWIRNQESAPSATAAFRAITATEAPSLRAPSAIDGEAKPAELAVLKRNVVGCLAVWAMDTRAMSIAELMSALLDGYWEPTVAQDPTESELLRALTDADQPVLAAAVSREFGRRMLEQMRFAERSAQAAAAAKSDLHRMSAEFDVAKSRVTTLEVELLGTRQSLKAEHDKARIDATHFRDDFETLRTRVLRRLSDDLKLLGDGLIALSRVPPKVDVMVDHAERVSDSLRSEIKKLEEGN